MSDNAQGRKYRLVVGEDKPESLVRTSTKMPPFLAPPEVVVWGHRFFTLVSEPDAEELVYREALAWFAAAEVLHEAPPAGPVGSS
jgi:hypothetical protein